MKNEPVRWGALVAAALALVFHLLHVDGVTARLIEAFVMLAVVELVRTKVTPNGKVPGP